MSKHITYAMTLLFATAALTFAAPDKDAMIAKEKAAWQAFKDKKADDFKKVVSADVVAVYAEGMMNMQGELDTMKKRDMKSFSLSDFNVVTPDADTVVISYKAKVESTTDGKDDSGDYNCGSIWHLKNGQWQAIFHADMKAEAAAAK
jgi:hypothetical protein